MFKINWDLILKINPLFWLLAILPTALILFSFIRLEKAEAVKFRQDTRLEIMDHLVVIRAQLEKNLNQSFMIAETLSAYIGAHPNIKSTEFTQIAKELLNGRPEIRNLAIIQGSVVKYAYPESGEEERVGTNIASKGQEADYWRVVYRRQVVVVGPVKLHQSGYAIIGRHPIFLNQSGDRALHGGAYWGQVSVMIDIPNLSRISGLYDENLPFEIALRNQDDQTSEIFYGETDIFTNNPVSLSVLLPEGTWQLGAVPKNGWVARPSGFSVYRLMEIFFLVFSAVLGIGVVLYTFVRRAAEAKLKESQLTLLKLNRRLKQEKELLRKLTITDELTRLYNRRYIVQRFRRELNKADRYQTKLTIIIFDIDHFKKINDQYGHFTGDEALRTISRVIAGQLREVDLVGRYGGEEFLVILPESDLEAGLAVAERIRQEVQAIEWSKLKLQVTISGGVAQYQSEEAGFELIRRADHGLYQAKSNGRNQIQQGSLWEEKVKE